MKTNSKTQNLVDEIKTTSSNIVKKVNEVINQSKKDFAESEKKLVLRCLETLNQKLTEYNESDINYKSLNGIWGKSICFNVEKWDEYKEYEKFFDRGFSFGVEIDTLNKALRSSFRKYGLDHGGVFKSNYNGKVEFSYEIFSLFPGISNKLFEKTN